MEEGHKPKAQPQRRLNPNMQEVVKKEILKWLAAGIIYPISDSMWRCEETNLVLNWEKCHFMVKEGIVLGHKVSYRGIEVDKAKVDLIAKLPPPQSVKEEKLTTAPIVSAPAWDLPFEIMCDASNDTLGAVLGQRVEKRFHTIYYASRTMNDAQRNYATTEKELLAVIFAIEKFRPYLLLSKER
ncbi:UNVERIFIED_CONTAM: Retrovirus-related Pol polyprotein from transposon opus [Sesamum radiatum]|uniref:Retrovirus-related Pol polyprotein from transposon opus n=1 Tax=Sesamum radiatum TaxID=300843 RepID=A0AAW2ILY4_SESRA